MANQADYYDSALMGILQNEGELPRFLDVVMGFLYRRTDFYLIMKEKTDRQGFPPGMALKILLTQYKKYENIAANVEERQKRKAAAVALKRENEAQPTLPETTQAVKSSSSLAGDRIAEELVKEQVCNGDSSGHKNDMDTTQQPFAETNVTIQESPDLPEPTTNKERSLSASSTLAEKDNDDNIDDDEESRLQKQFQANPESYNGAEREKYLWSQTIGDCDIRVKVPRYVKKGKDVRVEVQKKHLMVAHKTAQNNWVNVMNSDLNWEVNKEDAIWSLVPGEHVHINVEKLQERWWEAVFVDEPKINVRKIDCSRPMSDLNDETQAKLEEVMFNQRQKQLGLPQSHETKNEKLLRAAWDAEGSPFKGQPYDPSKLNIASTGLS